MKKSTTTVYTFAILFGVFSLVGWCSRHCSSPKSIRALSIALESIGKDTLADPGDGTSTFMRIRFGSLKNVKLDFRKYEMGDLDDFEIKIRIRLKDGRLIESTDDLRGVQDGNDLILRCADFRKRWHTSEEYDVFSQMCIEKVKSIYMRIYEVSDSDNPPVFAKRFTTFDTIAENDIVNYDYNYHHY